ncbi:MAG: SHOCT domain-containing protein [Actinomycetota bacterium]|nr:SHOCT domain-containing protein [Actinomycetota bacterium]
MADAAWHGDPFGRHELRYWDGTAWTAHVSDAGVTSTDEPVGTPVAASAATAPVSDLAEPQWKRMLKQATDAVTEQSKDLADKGKKALAEQQAKQQARQAAAPVDGTAPMPIEEPDETSSVAPIDVADQLRKLAELRDQGVLTEDEFSVQKQKLLGL